MGMDKLKRKWSELTLEEQNAFIAEQIFGREIVTERIWGRLLMVREDRPGLTEAIPNYLRIMDAAWTIVTHLGKVGETNILLSYVAQAYTRCTIDCYKEAKHITAFGETPMEAICLAALKYSGVQTT